MLPARYSIRIGRSLNVSGPYVDKDGMPLLDGGGYIVYGSNHGVVYAPGGTGVVTRDADPDIFYFHYCSFPFSLRASA
jgi:arabinan endo-1,5-alpha-L-arabinosidase